MRSFFTQVAPSELIRQDLRILRSSDRLETTKKIQEFLFIQSLEGRSHNGAGVFTKRTYVNTTIDDVVRALDLDPEGVKKERQILIDEIVDFAKDTMNQNNRDRLVNTKGDPLLGIPFFRDLKVNARDVVRGLYMGGLRDNIDVRKETEAIYEIKIGGGECCHVNVHKMVELNLDGERLAHEAHEDQIEEYKKCGLIVSDTADHQATEEEQRYFYIRHRVGPGQSDDAAIVIAGILYNIDVALGVFLSDAIDTLEKYAPHQSDQDQELSYYIARGFKDLKISMDDVYELTYLSTIPEDKEEFIPDSSLRYLLSINSLYNRCGIQNHLAYIAGKPVVEMPLSFKRILSTQFYEYIRKHLANARRIDALVVPDLNVEDSRRPAGDLAHQNYLIVSKDTPIADVVKEYRETKSEIIIVVDKGGRITGTLSATDLINLSARP